MCASRLAAVGLQWVAIVLMAAGAAGCSSDSGRFTSNVFASDPPPRNDVTGSIAPAQSGNRIESRPMPHLASADGMSGGGRGLGTYQPSSSEVTGSVSAPPPPPPPPPVWTWEGGHPVTIGPGETLETISRRYGVPVSAIMEANNITSPAMVRPGQHLVVPHYRSGGPEPAVAAALPPQTRLASNMATVPATTAVGPPRSALTPGSGVHVVAPGETLHSIARLYRKSVLALAKANNIRPDTMVRVGERIVIPDGGVATAAPPPTAAPARPATVATLPPPDTVAAAESPHSARLAAPTTPPDAPVSSVKATEPAGVLPGFRWPVRGRIIAGFGAKPNGLQNDGINLAVPEGTPVKAAEDGVVAYAGNELKGYGNLVLLRHANGFVTAYAHASELMVKRGDTVKRGQVIAKSGQTGNVTAPQLHFEIRKGATPVDPAQYLSGA
jgi:murein DD-endopeptidase MepM/ murein hydrolase activator NlpD